MRRLGDYRKLLTRRRGHTARNQVRLRINGGKSAAETAPSASACRSGAAVKGIGKSAKTRCDECVHGLICAARPMRPGTDYPSSAACDDRNVQRRPAGGALASTSRPCVRDRNPNWRRPDRGFGSRPLRRVEPRPEGQRPQPNPLEKCVHTRYMFPNSWNDFGGFGGRDPDDADDGK